MTGDHINAQISGDVSGQVAVGKDNVQTQATGDSALKALTPEEREQLAALFADLRVRVRGEAPPDVRDRALDRVDELEDAVTGEEPDPTTLQLVRRWFAKHAPALAGAVTSLVVHPLVGRLVEAAGDAVLGDDD
jgi:hypothetical protein